MTPHDCQHIIVAPALSLLPEQMDSPEARAMLVAIALQESGLQHRRQFFGGPARGFWQFEPAGIKGVLEHPASQELAEGVCRVMGYDTDIESVHAAIADNDILAACFARLLLWRFPEPLPAREQAPMGWGQYRALWKPGKPRRAKWPDNWAAAWDEVTRYAHA
jgi:hypothetical protein